MSDVLSDDELKVFTDAFFVFDEDRSGSITRDEVEAAFEKMDISKAKGISGLFYIWIFTNMNPLPKSFPKHL